MANDLFIPSLSLPNGVHFLIDHFQIYAYALDNCDL